MGFFASLSALKRDLDADAESKFAARRGVFLGGESETAGDLYATEPGPDALNFEKAEEEGRVRSVCTSTAIASVTVCRRY